MRLGNFVLKSLEKKYGDVKTPLHYHNVFELLIAVILSAQTNDNQVNKVTPALFSKYKTIPALADAELKDLEEVLRSINYYKSKAKNIRLCARRVLYEYDGEVPNSMEDLVSLAGVGRKTANVVLNEYFGNFQGVVVDTHVRRLSNRIGLSDSHDVLKVEEDLMEHFDRKDWEKISLLLIYHGRAVCDAKKPDCQKCSLSPKCLSYNKDI